MPRYIPVLILFLATSVVAAETPPQPGTKPKPLDPATLEKYIKSSPSPNEEDADPDWKKNDPFLNPELKIGKRNEVPQFNPPKSLDGCGTCKGRGRLTSDAAEKAYMVFENEDPQDPSVSLGWLACPDCKVGMEHKQRFEDELRRLAGRVKLYQDHERELKMAFVDFETRHVSGHFQTSIPEARECAKFFGQLAKQLSQKGCDTYLQGRPGAHHLIVCENLKSYKAYLSRIVAVEGGDDPNWLELAAQSSSFGSRNGVVIRRDKVVGGEASGLGHITIFAFANMQVREASQGKAPKWFIEGFSSLCESLIFETPWCYSVAYEKNQISFDADWSKAVAKGLREGRVAGWDALFTRDLISMPQVEYQQCWSVVRYLYKFDAPAFAKLPTCFAENLDSVKAIEKAYGHPIGKLETSWRIWAAQGK